MKEDVNKWKKIPCLWIRRYSIIEIPILPKLIYRFNVIPNKILLSFFVCVYGGKFLKIEEMIS